MSSIILSVFADEAAPDLAGQLQALQDNRLQAVDLRMVDGINIADFTAEKAHAVRDALDRAGIMTACLGSPIGKTSLNDDFRPQLDKMKRLCETAHILACPRIRIFSFYVPAGQAAVYRDEVLERLDRLLLVAADASVRLLHENETGIYGDIAERCLDLHQVFHTRLGGVLDPANYLHIGVDPLAAMAALDPWVEYLHIKDMRRSDGQIVPAGEGDGHVAQIIGRYLARPDRRHLAVEPHLFTLAARESAAAAMTRAVEACRRLEIVCQHSAPIC